MTYYCTTSIILVNFHLTTYAQASLEKSETLFNSLLQRAFKGELTQSQML
jgi:hypothetical protein